MYVRQNTRLYVAVNCFRWQISHHKRRLTLLIVYFRVEVNEIWKSRVFLKIRRYWLLLRRLPYAFDGSRVQRDGVGGGPGRRSVGDAKIDGDRFFFARHIRWWVHLNWDLTPGANHSLHAAVWRIYALLFTRNRCGIIDLNRQLVSIRYIWL